MRRETAKRRTASERRMVRSCGETTKLMWKVRRIAAADLAVVHRRCHLRPKRHRAQSEQTYSAGLSGEVSRETGSGEGTMICNSCCYRPAVILQADMASAARLASEEGRASVAAMKAGRLHISSAVCRELRSVQLSGTIDVRRFDLTARYSFSCCCSERKAQLRTSCAAVICEHITSTHCTHYSHNTCNSIAACNRAAQRPVLSSHQRPTLARTSFTHIHTHTHTLQRDEAAQHSHQPLPVHEAVSLCSVATAVAAILHTCQLTFPQPAALASVSAAALRPISHHHGHHAPPTLHHLPPGHPLFPSYPLPRPILTRWPPHSPPTVCRAMCCCCTALLAKARPSWCVASCVRTRG